MNHYRYAPNPVGFIDPWGLVHESTPGYTVYALYDKDPTNPYYIGITDDYSRRKAEHIASGRLEAGGGMMRIEVNVNYGQARGYEQAYIEHYETKTGIIGDAISSENRGNKVNSFDKESKVRDPKRQKAFMDACQEKHSELKKRCP